ncbi:MAG TPA: hypothetical protein VIV60_25970 [Polyangiaceae bacterium]
MLRHELWLGVGCLIWIGTAGAAPEKAAHVATNSAAFEEAAVPPPPMPMPTPDIGDAVRSSAVSADSRTPTREIEIHASHVEIEGPFNRLSLSKGVELTVHRYRVTADRLTLERTAQGIAVDGAGRVAFCPCDSSPLTVGFTRATVAPPTDLLLRNATFVACGVPVFWLPIYWVRSPNKMGLLTPTLGYRGSEGPWIGTGVHIPLPSKETTEREMDLLVGTYLLGGVDLGTRIRTPRATFGLRWDHFERSLLQVESDGYHHWDNRSSLAWHVDALRGARARTGPVSFEAATRNFDRIRAEWSSGTGPSLFSIGFQGDMVRGTSFTDVGRLGPSARFGTGAALGDWGRIDSSLLVSGQLGNASNANALALQSTGLGVDFRPGPAVVHFAAHEQWLMGSGRQRNFDAGSLSAELKAGLPLIARFGSDYSKTVHWLEPFIVAAGAQSMLGDAYHHVGADPVLTTQVGVSNKLGQLSAGTAASLQLRLGAITDRRESLRAGAARWLASGNWLALGGDIALTEHDSWMSTVRARIGRLDRISLRARAEGMNGTESARLRWLFDEGWTPWLSRWYSRQGWLLSSDVDLAVGHQIAATAGAAYDVGSNALVTEQAGVAYRHPCGCLASSAKAGWRVGRSGWDILILLDLMP